jgi:hypothetical protein
MGGLSNGVGGLSNGVNGDRLVTGTCYGNCQGRIVEWRPSCYGNVSVVCVNVGRFDGSVPLQML